ncbi:MAG: PQQ-binding-like beta-propeller repeat protein [Planctomycetaceae bacterium]
MKRTRLLAGVVVVGSLIAVFSSANRASAQYASESGVWRAEPMDWPFWRGPEMNGVSRETGLVAKWNQRGGKGSNVLWFNDKLAGRSTPIVMDGKLYTIIRDKPETKEEGEKVVCADAKTGKILWENRFNVFLSDVPDTRVGWSSVVGDPETGDVFALGVCGYFQCIDGKTGKTKWSHSMSEKYGLLSTFGGRTNFPVIHGNLVIISAIVIGWGETAKPAHRFIAFDKRNGQPVWMTGTRILPFDTTYSTPILTVINGEAQMIFASGDGAVHGFQPQTGRELWKYQVSPKRGVNTTPLVVGNRVFCGHAEENVGDTTMGALFAIRADMRGKDGKAIELTKANGGELWRHNQWNVGKSMPILVNGFLYAAENGGNLRVVEAKTGKLIQSLRLGGPVHGSPLYADGKLYLCTSNGRWWTFQPQKDGKLKRLFRARLNRTEVHASPIVSHGRIYVATTSGIYCLGKMDAKPAAVARPKFPVESPLETDPDPAQLQIVPAESLLKPKQKQQFQVRLYNSRGQFLRTASAGEVKFTATGGGKIDKSGKYTPKAGGKPYAVDLTATFGKLSGKTRIRVVPELPWSVDFNDGVIPVTWVGCRYRHIPLDYKLYSKLKDQNKDLMAARLYLYLQTGFVNGLPRQPKGTLTYDNKAPRRLFDDLLRYLGLLDKVTSLKDAQEHLESRLKLLKAEKVIAGYQWSESPTNGYQLVVKQGSRKIDGEGVMVKIKTIPKGQRSQGWMGHTDFSNYTFQADVLGADRVSKSGNETIVKMPDIGISAQRYALVLKATQRLEIRTWHPQLRMAASVPFKWQPNKWYTLKLKASLEGGEAVLRGKCWERGKPEPKNWQVEARDPRPNKRGSPGLFGDAIKAEIFYDNIKVTPNK